MTIEKAPVEVNAGLHGINEIDQNFITNKEEIDLVLGGGSPRSDIACVRAILRT